MQRCGWSNGPARAISKDAHREVALCRGAPPEATSAALAAQLLGKDIRPSEAAMRAERKILLQQALNTLDPVDREILALRHFEQLSTAETARVLSPWFSRIPWGRMALSDGFLVAYLPLCAFFLIELALLVQAVYIKGVALHTWCLPHPQNPSQDLADIKRAE